MTWFMGQSSLDWLIGPTQRPLAQTPPVSADHNNPLWMRETAPSVPSICRGVSSGREFEPPSTITHYRQRMLAKSADFVPMFAKRRPVSIRMESKTPRNYCPIRSGKMPPRAADLVPGPGAGAASQQFGSCVGSNAQSRPQSSAVSATARTEGTRRMATMPRAIATLPARCRPCGGCANQAQQRPHRESLPEGPASRPRPRRPPPAPHAKAIMDCVLLLICGTLVPSSK